MAWPAIGGRRCASLVMAYRLLREFGHAFTRLDTPPFSIHHHPGSVIALRNAIERMFCRLKDYRRIATRYDKLAVNFMSAVYLAATVSYWL